MKLKYDKKTIEIIVAVLLIILFIVGLILLFYKPTNTNNQTNNIVGDQMPAQILPVLSKTQIKLQDKTVALPSGWKIQTAVNSSDGTGFECIGTSTSSCTIYYVNNGANTFYISSPVGVKVANLINPQNETKKLSFLTNLVDFTYEKYGIVKRVGDTVTVVNDKVYSQAYGCGNKICVSSGLLSYDINTNKKQVADFEELVKDLKFQ